MAASEATDQPLGCRVSFGEGQGSLVDGKLLAKGEVLEGELTVTAEEEGEEPEQLEQQGDHRAAIVAGPGPTDQSLGCRTRFWRSTADVAALGSARCVRCIPTVNASCPAAVQALSE